MHLKRAFVGFMKLIIALFIIMILVMTIETILSISDLRLKIGRCVHPWGITFSFLVIIIIPFLIAVGLGTGITVRFFNAGRNLAILIGFCAGFLMFVLTISKVAKFNIIILVILLNSFASAAISMLAYYVFQRKKLLAFNMRVEKGTF